VVNDAIHEEDGEDVQSLTARLSQNKSVHGDASSKSFSPKKDGLSPDLSKHSNEELPSFKKRKRISGIGRESCLSMGNSVFEEKSMTLDKEDLMLKGVETLNMINNNKMATINDKMTRLVESCTPMMNTVRFTQSKRSIKFGQITGKPSSKSAMFH
jgi:hypothetical protein